VRLKHQNGKDLFEPGEFIYSCRSGHFHFKIDFHGALEEIISDFDNKVPEFITQLILDFPGKNYEPDDKLLKDIDTCGLMNNRKFLNGLKPRPPINVEVD
jgi:hypothetical protein